jgi:hypothetical protein
MNKNLLTKKEMETLSGGIFTDLVEINSKTVLAKEEVKNINKVKDCRCYYCNLGISNTNQKTGCACECI